MSKRWSGTDDMWLCMYFDSMGAKSCSEDLKRPLAEVERRYAMLVKSGAMALLTAEFEAHQRYEMLRDSDEFLDFDDEEPEE